MVKKNPPVVSHVPILGNLLEFNRNRLALFRNAYEKHGNIYTIHLGPKPVVVLIGPKYQEFFFEETDKKLSMAKAYRFFSAMFDEFMFLAGPEAYRQQRDICFAPLRAEKMARHVRVMIEEVESTISSLGDRGKFELSATFQSLTQNIAAHSLLGRDFRENAGKEFWAAYVDLVKGIDPILPPKLPIPRFVRRDRAKRKIKGMVESLIAERKKSGVRCDDFMQDFIESRLKDGSEVPQATIVSMIVGLIFAGHETTVGQGCWSLIELLRHPEYLQKVMREVDSSIPSENEVTIEGLRNLKHLSWALKEVERLHPSADVLLRYNLEDYELGDYHIPRDWLSMVVPVFAHRLPELFENPDRFDPLRFAPGREEHKVSRYAMIGFGGGSHKCIGSNFAAFEMMIFIGLLLRRYRLELLTESTTNIYSMGAPRPSPTWIGYERRQVVREPKMIRRNRIRANEDAVDVELQ